MDTLKKHLNKMVKVAHITTVDLSMRMQLLNQLKSIQADGYSVSGISSPGPDVPTIEAAGVRHFGVSITRRLSPFADLLSLWRLVKLMRQEKFDIVHTHTPKPSLLGQMAARIAGVPIVMNTIHGFYFHDGTKAPWRQFYILMEKIAARFSDIILSQNSEDMVTAVQENICPKEQIKYLGNGIDIHQFNPSNFDKSDRLSLCREIGLNSQQPIIGFVGRLVAEKGILELLEAAKLVLDELPGAQFLIIGPIDRAKPDALNESAAQQFGVESAVFFTGRRNDMPEMYSLMDVFVLPSHREGFPRSSMEASAMSIPAVVTDIRGCREAVTHNENGLLVPLGDVPALANAILSLLKNPTWARKLGEKGRETAESKFDERLVFQKVKAEYARLLCEKKIPLPKKTNKISHQHPFST